MNPIFEEENCERVKKNIINIKKKYIIAITSMKVKVNELNVIFSHYTKKEKFIYTRCPRKVS